MKTYLRDQIDWDPSFPAEEYAARRNKVRRALAEANLDALYVTTPANLTWLTGYDMIWYHLQSLTGLLVRADADEPVFFDSVGHVTIVSTTPEIRDVVWLERPVDAAPDFSLTDVIVAELDRRGLGNARIGLAKWGYAPHASVLAELEMKLVGRGATVSDAWALVEQERLVKSPLEIAHVRNAAAIADHGMAAGRDAIRIGVTETELEGAIVGSMMKAGGGYPSIRTMIGSGPRAGTHHSPAMRRRIKHGELVFIDLCGCYDRYHVNCNRTFSLGPPDRRWTDLMARSAGCIDAIQAEVKLGQPMSEVERVAQRYIDSVGLRK